MLSNPPQAGAMDFRSTRAGRVLIVTFHRSLTLSSLRRALDLINGEHKSGGFPVSLIIVVPAGLEPLDASLRKAVMDATPAMLKDCESVDVVLLGEGMLKGLSRTVLRGMILATRSGSQIYLHDTLENAARRLARKGIDASRAIEQDAR
jgi:hypothetical protein